MALPNPGMDAVPFTPLTAEFLDNIIENIESLSDGTGFQNGAITTNTLAESAVGRSKVDWSTFNLNTKGAVTTTSRALTNGSNIDLATNGATVSFTLSGSGYALAVSCVSFISTSDFEARPLIYVNGSYYSTGVVQPPASVGNASGRAIERVAVATIPLSNGANTVSAGAFVSSATSPQVTSGGASIHVIVFGNVTA